MIIKSSVYQQIVFQCPSAPPESGGILGKRNGVVCAFHFDVGLSSAGGTAYAPNVNVLNHKILEWQDSGIEFCGIAHSHAVGKRLSSGDIAYIQDIMEEYHEGTVLYFPIIIPKVELLSFRAEVRHGKLILSHDIIIFEGRPEK